MKETLEKLKTNMEEVAGEWNGNESGSQEDRAHISLEIIEKIEEIKKLLEELSETY